MVKTGTEGRAVVKVVLADLFYRVFNTLSEVSVASGSSDFRLLDRRCVLALRSMPERRRFLRGLTRWIGFEQIELPYEAPVRHAGRPQYTLRRLAGLAGTGFLSFSAPLRLGIPLGAATLLVALGLGATFLLSPELARRPLTVAWVVPLLAVGGLLLFGLGVLGAYVAVLLDEARRRPLYFISDSVNIELAHDR
jgi:dolichol-phosphate mannosyltransferase